MNSTNDNKFSYNYGCPIKAVFSQIQVSDKFPSENVLKGQHDHSYIWECKLFERATHDPLAMEVR